MKYGPIYLTIIVALFLRFFIMSVYQVPSLNMSPTFVTGDYVLSWKNEYNFRSPFSNSIRPIRQPQRGELIVYTQNSKVLIRRVLGLPNESIEFKNLFLLINDQRCLFADFKASLDENYQFATETCQGVSSTVLLPKDAQLGPTEISKQLLQSDQFLVMSDNRSRENNPNSIEIIKFDQIIGKPVLIWMSYGSTQDFISEDKGIRWNRILTKPL